MIVACEGGKTGMVRWLLQRPGIDVNACDSTGVSALYTAVAHKAVDVVRLLLQHEANVNTETSSGCTSLGLMTSSPECYHTEILKMLIEHGADVELATYGWTNLTVLHVLCTELDDDNWVENLISLGCDVNAQTTRRANLILNFRLIEFSKVTAAHVASNKGHASSLRALLRNNADPNKTDEFGRSPLQLACFKGHSPCVEELVSNGCRINAQCSGNGPTALYLASELGHVQCVEALLRGGADPNVICSGSKQFGNKLKQWTFRPDNDVVGTTLHRAAKHGHNLCVEKLLSSGADPRKKNGQGLNPLHITCRQGRRQCVLPLLTVCDVNALSNEKLQAIHYAAQHGSRSIVDILLDKGAVIDKRSVKHPHELATQHGHTQLADHLCQFTAAYILPPMDGLCVTLVDMGIRCQAYSMASQVVQSLRLTGQLSTIFLYLFFVLSYQMTN